MFVSSSFTPPSPFSSHFYILYHSFPLCTLFSPSFFPPPLFYFPPLFLTPSLFYFFPSFLHHLVPLSPLPPHSTTTPLSFLLPHSTPLTPPQQSHTLPPPSLLLRLFLHFLHRQYTVSSAHSTTVTITNITTSSTSLDFTFFCLLFSTSFV